VFNVLSNNNLRTTKSVNQYYRPPSFTLIVILLENFTANLTN